MCIHICMFLWSRKTKTSVCVEEDTCGWEDVMRITKHRWLKCVHLCVRVCVYVCARVQPERCRVYETHEDTHDTHEDTHDTESIHKRKLTIHMRKLILG